MVKAFVIDEADGKVTGTVRELDDSALPAEGLRVKVDYSTLNYKDGMVINGIGRLVRSYPHVPGVDLAGVVEDSSDPRFSVGDRVVVTGWRVGEVHWGGYATVQCVNPDFAIKLPDSLSTFAAMALGTAGLTAMLAIMALEDHHLSPAAEHPVLVTGAAGGVGSIAVLALSRLGYRVSASTGRMEEEAYLRSLGATEVVARQELSEPSNRPLESARFSGAIDNVGGTTLGRLLGQLDPGASVASVGLAGGSTFAANVMPFVVRGCNILGIDSVTCPNARREAAWMRLSEVIPRVTLESLTSVYGLQDLDRLADEILVGHVKGRVVIDVNA